MEEHDIMPDLFRSEYSRIVAVLTHLFGIENVQVAEDLASETFLAAMETWPYRGIPANPSAWLFATAKNKAINQYTRNAVFREKVAVQLRSGIGLEEGMDLANKAETITDSQLQMLFAVCHPTISEKSQICLALRILCGFGIDEIARAFLNSKETINKRLRRAKEKLRTGKVRLEIPGAEQLPQRLDAVLRTIYLVFNEGYYSESGTTLIRRELCFEAMNLTYLLLQNNSTNTHSTNSLMALICFHSSRLEARLTDKGEIILYPDQDENRWDTELVEKGFIYLRQASIHNTASKYYLEASIAYWHTVKGDSTDKWNSILKLYGLLLKVDYTPIADLNRIFALSKVRGSEQALAEAEKLKLEDNHFYYLLLGELYKGTDRMKTIRSLEKALAICKTETERIFIGKKIRDQEKLVGKPPG